MRRPCRGVAADASRSPSAAGGASAGRASRVAHDLGAIERRAQHRGMRDLTAQAAADAALHDGCNRIGAQRIGRGLHGERRAARQPDAGMVAGADLVVDAVAGARHALAALEFLGVLGAHAALARELAFAVGDDDLEAFFGGVHRLLQRLHHLADAVGAHRAQPFHAHRAQRLLYIDAGRRAVAAGRARRDVLLAGGGGVAVLHHDQHAVAFVEQIRGDAGDQAVMPEAAVAHDRDRAPLHIGRHRRGAGKRHAVTEDGIAERERCEGRKRVTADVGRDVRRAEFALDQLDSGEYRPLRAAGARTPAAAAAAVRAPQRPSPCVRSARALSPRGCRRQCLSGRVGLQERREAFQQHIG